MTWTGARHRAFSRPKHITGMWLSGWLLLMLSLLVIATAAIFRAPFAVWLLSLFVAANLAHKAALTLWAARTRRVAGTKLLGIFSALFGIAYALTPWFMGVRGAYLGVTVGLGALIVLVATYDAFISPDEDRRVAFEPREPPDVSDYELREHGSEHARP